MTATGASPARIADMALARSEKTGQRFYSMSGQIRAERNEYSPFAKEPLSERQIEVLNRLMDGFEGKLTSSIWAKIAKCSQDTAYRDIMDLVERGALQKAPGGGRSTSYSLADSIKPSSG